MTTDITVLWEVQPVGPALWGGPAANGQRGTGTRSRDWGGCFPPMERDCERTEGAPTSHQAAHQLRTALTAEPLVIKKDRWKGKKYFNINKYISLAKVLCSPEKLWVLTKVLHSPRNFALFRKTFAFSHKKYCVFYCVLSQKYWRFPEKICLYTKFNSIQVSLYSAFYDTIVAKQLYRKLSFCNIFIYCWNLIYLTYGKIW